MPLHPELVALLLISARKDIQTLLVLPFFYSVGLGFRFWGYLLSNFVLEDVTISTKKTCTLIRGSIFALQWK